MTITGLGKLYSYVNGNANVTIFNDGTRIIETENDVLELETPNNLDIRVSTSCSFGQKDDGSVVLCEFCHESAKVNGKDCDYELLQQKLEGLPKGVELAIGCNSFTESLYNFLQWCYNQDYICNLTINQGHIKRDYDILIKAIKNNLIKGLGISYRKELKWSIPKEILNYSNTVFHVIIGIDSFNDVLELKNKGVNKLLLLGAKSHGFNEGKVDLNSRNHKEWYWWVVKLFNKFEVVSFDNLAVEQLNLKRFFTNRNWETFFNGEYSFYIDAVNQTFSPNSRSKDKVSWDNFTIRKYFKHIIYADKN